MDKIPQIKPKYSVEEAKEEGSILIPKITFKSDHEDKVGEKHEGRKKEKWYKKKWVRISAVVTCILFLLAGFLGLAFYNVYRKALILKDSANNLKTSFQSQDIAKVKEELVNTRASIDTFEKSYKKVSWLGVTPFVGSYLRDAQHAINASKYGLDSADVLIEIMEPYADIIGFSPDGSGPSSGEETAQDRVDFIVKTIPEVIPRADELIEKVSLTRNEVDKINLDKYPEKFFGKSVRPKLKEVKELIDSASKLVENSKPLLEVAPHIMGVDGERTYMVIFQNDKELRPTGGFITAYSIAKVRKGKFEPVISSDIYNLDSYYTPDVAAPDPIVKYLKGPYVLSKKLRLRDMNWSPDFGQSMELFSDEIASAGIKDIDGIIAVDTSLLVNILDVLGPIGVSGYGEFSTKIVPECNCPQVIYDLESFADIEGPIVWSENEPGKIVYAPPNYDNRKKIIGPLMNSILSNALGQSKEKIPALFEAVFNSLLEKHVLFYLLDEASQNGVETFGIAGKIKNYDGDYLHINDANLGGRKSNLYMTQEVNQAVDVQKDGSVVKTVTITYKNPEKQDGWLNSVLPNYVRIYVPKGSELIDFSGVEDKTDPYEEFEKTVFAGFFELRPQGVAKVEVQYKLPFKVDKDYRMLIQKQPGTDKPLYTIELGKKTEEFFLKTDKELKFGI